jgi:hypothetical protein
VFEGEPAKLTRKKIDLMNKVYIHIGFPKTGSSALQHYLRDHSESLVTIKGEKLAYCCIQNDGNIIKGQELLAASGHGLVSDPNVAQKPISSLFKNNLRALFDSGLTPVFSQEDWGRRAEEFVKANFFASLDCHAHIIAYIRPQVDWFNSAWWQWWEWDDLFESPSDVINTWSFNYMNWGRLLTLWKHAPGVQQVSVRLLGKDVIQDFCDMMNLPVSLDATKRPRVNPSLTPTLIKVLKRCKNLRGPHTPNVDTILSRHLQFGGNAPWVITADLCERIIQLTRKGNLQLLEMLDPHSKHTMKNDARWWNPSAYETKKVWAESDYKLTDQEVDDVLQQAMHAIIQKG